MDPEPSSLPTEVVAAPAPASPQKWHYIVGGFLLLLIGVTGGVFLDMQMSKSTVTPTPIAITPTHTVNPTTNWQVYSSEQFDYQISYPSDWVATPNSGNLNLRRQNDPVPSESGFSIYVHPNKTGLLASELCNSKTENLSIGLLCSTGNLPTREMVLIGDNSWEKLAKDQVSLPPTGYVLYDTLHTGNLYLIYNYGYDENIISQILSTFQFTNISAFTGKIQIYSLTASDLTLENQISSSSPLKEMVLWMDDTTSKNWIPYQQVIKTTIPASRPDCIYAQFKDEAGRVSQVFSDPIGPGITCPVQDPLK